MAKLLIFRGEAQLDARELTEKTIRIGRGTQNDIVLEDPGKGVSRNHAEIRFEGGRYTLVDVQSQNGIWVSGERVPSVILEPGLSAALGPFRLMLEAPVATVVAALTPVSGISPVTEMTQLSTRTAAPLQLDSLAPPVEKPSPVAPPVSKAPTPPPVKAPPKAAPAKPTPEKAAPKPVQKTPAGSGSSMNTRTLGAVAVAVVLIALSAFIGYKLMHRSPPPVIETATAPTTSVPVPSSVTTTIPAPPPIDERLNEVEPIVLANVAADCQTQIPKINDVLTEDPTNERAKALLAKANACANPTKVTGPVSGPPEKAGVTIPPAQGGLVRAQGETDRAYKERIQTMRKKYDDAVALLTSQKYGQAMKALDEILPDVPSGYLELAARREEARNGIRAEAKTTLGNARAAENSGDLEGAAELYRRAHQLDQSLPVDDALQRIADRRLTLGHKKCTDGLTEFSFGNNNAALPLLQEAIKLLPPSDPCVAQAKEKLQKLK